MTDSRFSLLIGENHSLQIIIIEPFFEEANRCRRLIATMMRALNEHGIGSSIAILPGTSESLVSIADIRLADWRASLAGLSANGVVSLRGGALVDDAVRAPCHWRFAPETGNRIARDLKRTALTGSSLYAGHPVSELFVAELEECSPVSLPKLRTVRLESDAGVADVKFDGSPLWRRAEPGEDASLAAALADDLANWVKQCAVS